MMDQNAPNSDDGVIQKFAQEYSPRLPEEFLQQYSEPENFDLQNLSTVKLPYIGNRENAFFIENSPFKIKILADTDAGQAVAAGAKTLGKDAAIAAVI